MKTKADKIKQLNEWIGIWQYDYDYEFHDSIVKSVSLEKVKKLEQKKYEITHNK